MYNQYESHNLKEYEPYRMVNPIPANSPFYSANKNKSAESLLNKFKKAVFNWFKALLKSNIKDIDFKDRLREKLVYAKNAGVVAIPIKRKVKTGLFSTKKITIGYESPSCIEKYMQNIMEAAEFNSNVKR